MSTLLKTVSEYFRFKARTYLHFDLPVAEQEVSDLLADPEKIARHSFYPFLGYTLSTLRIKRDDGDIVKRPKHREIRFASHKDAAVYSYYSFLLSREYEKAIALRGLGACVKAFRVLPGGGTNIDFAGEVFDFIDNHRPCVALAFDVEKFFDSLSHKHLKNAWAELLKISRLPTDHYAVFKSLTKYSWVSRDEVYKTFGISVHNPKPRGSRRMRICTAAQFRSQIRDANLLKRNPELEKGIPQGSPISAVLSNLYMLEFDSTIAAWVQARGGLYRRYCDDVMIVVPPDFQEEAEALVVSEITRFHLSLNTAKTDRAKFPNSGSLPSGESIQYLGFTYDGVRKLLRLGSLSRYYGKMRRGVRLAKLTQRKHNRLEYAAGLPLTSLKLRKLYFLYSYLISRRTRSKRRDPKAHGNFLTYAYRSADKLSSKHIRQQVSAHWKKLRQEIEKPLG